MAKILIVEDDESRRFLYHEELVEEGYEVDLAKNGVEASKCLEGSPFDLVVLYIRMPILNGTEVLGKITSRYKEIPVIIHTAYPKYKNQFISLMVDGFVLKSSNLSLLKATVSGLLEKKKQRGENENGRRKANDCWGNSEDDGKGIGGGAEAHGSDVKTYPRVDSQASPGA